MDCVAFNSGHCIDYLRQSLVCHSDLEQIDGKLLRERHVSGQSSNAEIFLNYRTWQAYGCLQILSSLTKNTCPSLSCTQNYFLYAAIDMYMRLKKSQNVLAFGVH